MIAASLNEIQALFKEQKITCELVESEKRPPTLLVIMGTVKIRINLLKRDLPAPLETGLEPQKKAEALFLYFHYFFPFTFKEEAAADLARYLLILNRSLEFPGFGLSEKDKAIYFRQELYCGFSKIQRRMVLSILGYMLLMIDSFGPSISQIAKLKKTLGETI